MEASLSKEEKLRYEKNWDRISSEKTLLTAAREEGKEEGREEGREEGLIMVARNARKAGMSIDRICELTGLSREEVERLLP